MGEWINLLYDLQFQYLTLLTLSQVFRVHFLDFAGNSYVLNRGIFFPHFNFNATKKEVFMISVL